MTGFAENKNFFTVQLVILTILMILRFELLGAVRILEGDELWMKREGGLLLLEALPRGKVPPSKSSPCTNIPGQSKGGHCALQEMNAAGRGMRGGGYVRAPPAFPDFVIEVGAAAADSHPYNQEARS
ncbi:hypothetical protein Ancab_022409 [Ancistrocladus abbreviatus]